MHNSRLLPDSLCLNSIKVFGLLWPLQDKVNMRRNAEGKAQPQDI